MLISFVMFGVKMGVVICKNLVLILLIFVVLWGLIFFIIWSIWVLVMFGIEKIIFGFLWDLIKFINLDKFDGVLLSLDFRLVVIEEKYELNCFVIFVVFLIVLLFNCSWLIFLFIFLDFVNVLIVFYVVLGLFWFFLNVFL